MDFAAYASRAFALPRLNLEADSLRKLGRLLDRETSLGEISKGYAAELGGTFPDDYVVAREIWHDYLAWRQVVKDVSTRRMEAGRYLLPEDTIRTTWSPEGIRLLEEVDVSFSPDASGSHAAWHQTLASVAAAWQANLRAAFEQGTLRARSTSGGGEVTEHRFSEISCTDWLRLINAEEDGRSQLELELPPLEFGALTSALEVDGNGEDEDAAEKLRRLQAILEDHIEDGVRSLMMRRSVIRAFLEADATYRGRLELRPLAGDQVRAVYVAAPQRAMGLAVVRRDGHVVETTVVDSDTSADEILAWMTTQAADDDPVVVPEWEGPFELLEMLSNAIPQHARMMSVPSDGLPGPADEGPGQALTDAAVELGRRAFKPRRTWLECPVSSMELLGRGVRLPTSDAGKLNRNMQEIRDEMSGGSTRNRGKVPKEPTRQSHSPQASDARKKKKGKHGKTTNRNPQVNKITDLEPGMELQGKVTNLNRFGAFVDVGIPKEGLIPMHSLTDGSADAPTSVVRPGYEVLVKVVSVNPSRRRFDLQLEQILAKGKNTGKRGRSRGGRKGGRGSQGDKQRSSSGGSQAGGQSASRRS